MDMKIQGDKGALQPNQVKRTQGKPEGAEAKQGQGEDKVSFSSVLQQASRNSGVVAPPATAGIEGLRPPIVESSAALEAAAPSEDAQRSERVSALKQQVADGSYQPDLKKVAGSMLQFLAQERDV
ncbi:MAG: flagellar biosynthesis anti-sigma factor FlgM [Geobacteraceae bacterium]|nr:flagellar biosynthesis anti-sigma factor FlgM [Geobacteraceae bacterium]